MSFIEYERNRLSRPLVIAHRGSSGTAPENTLVAFAKANELGVDYLELDIQATSDQKLVVIHDLFLDRTTNGSGGPIYIYDYEFIKQLDAGYRFTLDRGKSYPYRNKNIRIPTLDQVFKNFPQQKLIIEIKQYLPPIEKLLVDAIKEAKAEDRVIVSSFNHRVLKRFRALAPDIRTSSSNLEWKIFWILYKLRLSFLYPFKAKLFLVPVFFNQTTIISPRFVEAVHAKKIELFVWTINEERKMKELVKLGVDGIVTDYPELLIRILEEET
jgi:glycerophosphoryl diester phosphodiesterase